MKLFWFSGTGNSLWAAKKIAYATKAELVSIAALRDEAEIPVEDDALGFFMPTYWGDIPETAKKVLLRLRAPGDAYCFAVVTTSDGNVGASFMAIDRALCAAGLTLRYARALQMPSNVAIRAGKGPKLPSAVTEKLGLPMGAPESEVRKAILKAAPAEITDILGDVFHREENYTSAGTPAGRGFVRHTPFHSPHAPVKRFKITEDCDGCGLCVRLCPMGNIALRDGKPIHGNGCANCFACVHWCPKTATRPKLPILKRVDIYTHPNIRPKDFGK